MQRETYAFLLTSTCVDKIRPKPFLLRKMRKSRYWALEQVESVVAGFLLKEPPDFPPPLHFVLPFPPLLSLSILFFSVCASSCPTVSSLCVWLFTEVYVFCPASLLCEGHTTSLSSYTVSLIIWNSHFLCILNVESRKKYQNLVMNIVLAL